MTQDQKQQSSDSPHFRLAIAATFTAEPLRPVLAFWGRRLGAGFDLRFAPYNQVQQTLADPASEFAANTHGVNIVLLRADDLGAGENLTQLAVQIAAAPPRFHVPLVVCLCPSTLEAAGLDALASSAGVHVLTAAQIERWYPVPAVHDPEGERIGRIPYTEAFYCALATSLVRYAHALVRPPFKVIALDCDNTLWQGICGEDGPEGVSLEQPHRDLHEFMLAQRGAGMLLTLASKNNEADVLETFRVHPEMPLQPNHFVTWRLNWDSKAENLTDIAGQLNLGLDSFIFVDDNPKECAEVLDAVPEVLAVPLPIGGTSTRQFLSHLWAFDHPVITAEDRQRSASYERAAEFGNQVRSARSLEDFMASLNLRVETTPVARETLPRAAQLTQRTNQFNLTAIRRSEGDIEALLGAGYDCCIATVADRFGDYGVTGLLIARPEGSTYAIDTFLLSCRVLGRGVEHRVLASVGRRAASLGLETVSIPYRRTTKNEPAREFLDNIEGATLEDMPDGFVLRVPSTELAALKWKPSRAKVPAPAPARKQAQIHRTIDYVRIAAELSTADDILSAMRKEIGPLAADASMTELEVRLAAIWSDLLEKPSIRATDNFFDLGGHSLLAVLLLLRVREAFGVELSIDDVYSGTLTLSDMAARIEAAQLGGIDPEEYAALLAEIESLSDEEARELLARENPEQHN